MTTRPSILIIYTGGTIGMVQETGTGILKPFDFDHLLKQIPELKNFDINLSTVAFDEPIDSANMKPQVWVELVEIIAAHYDFYDGFVVLHGSDTMSYTASALSFMLENLDKPVILTGSQLPMGVIRTDGKENLITAIEIAADLKNGKPIVPDVAIYFEYMLYQGNRTHKHNAAYFEAFESPNYPLLAQAGIRIHYDYSVIRKPLGKPLKTHTSLDSNIGILKLFPGITPNIVDGILNLKGLKAVILETFGSGNAMTDPWFVNSLKAASDKGIIIFNVTQCNRGKVEQGRYQTSALLQEAGVISGEDITTEAAVTKLMFLLGKEKDLELIKTDLKRPLRGEMG